MDPAARFGDGEACGREYRSFRAVLGARQQRGRILCGRQAKAGRCRWGVPQTLAAAQCGGGAWSETGFIVYAPSNSGLYRIPADGGKATQLTSVCHGEVTHYNPNFLPDGRLMYSAWGTPASSGYGSPEMPSKGPVVRAEVLLKGGEPSSDCRAIASAHTCTLFFGRRRVLPSLSI